MKTSSIFDLARGASRAAASAVVALSLVMFVGAAFAQEFKEANVDDSLASQKDSVVGSGDSAQIKNFLTKYYLARWTVRANARDIVKYRQELVQDGVNLSGAAQSTFLKEVVGVLKSYAGSSACYPACRYNAVLAIGELNTAAGADRNSGGTPYADAIPDLANMITSSKDVPDYVRYGALIGLVRHAQLGIKDEKLRNGVKTTFAKVLGDKFAEEHKIREEIYECFAENAVAGLASFKSPEGTKGGSGTLDLFKKMIEDKDASFELRCIAAKAIGDMNLDALKTYDYPGLARSLVTLARDFCVEESQYIDSELVRDSVKSAASGMGGMGGMSGGMGGMSGGLGGMSGGMDMAGGMGGMGGMSGGMGGGMTGSIQNQKSMEAIVARVQYGFECIQTAIKGKKDGGPGVLAKLDANDEKQAEVAQMLKDALDEFKSTNEFIEEGPKNGGGMGMGMTGGMMGDYGAAAGSNIKVGANDMKDHLLEKKLKFNELLGIDSY
ncbi:MAG: hypothetical protein IJM54_07210 [Thermoguttaceae bacterium]|nr:hypothetical protein [Thermoguttaceae bacterium]